MSLYKSPGGNGLLVGPNGHPTSDPLCCECGKEGSTCIDCYGLNLIDLPVAIRLNNATGCLSGLDGCYPTYISYDEGLPGCIGGTTMDYDGNCGPGLLGIEFHWVGTTLEVQIILYDSEQVIAEWQTTVTCDQALSGLEIVVPPTTGGIGGGGEVTVQFGDECASAAASFDEPSEMIMGEQYPPEPISFEPAAPRAPLSEQVRAVRMRKSPQARNPRAARKVKQRPPEIGNWLRRLLSKTSIKPKRGFGCSCNFRLLDGFDGDYWTRDGKREFLISQLASQADRLKLEHTPAIIERIANLVVMRARHVDRWKRLLLVAPVHKERV